MGALRVLALTLRDVAAAEAYARAHLEPPQFRALLQLVLEPGPGLEPRWDDACYLLAALGALRCAALGLLGWWGRGGAGSQLPSGGPGPLA